MSSSRISLRSGSRFRSRVVAAWLLMFCYATVWASHAPPVITAVTPNPLTVGTITVTIQGSGFTSSSMIYDSYGSNNMIEYSPTSFTANTITATIYQGPAATSTFCVGSSTNCSNSIAVPVGSQSSSSGSSSSSTGSSSNGSGSGSSGSSSSAPVISSVSPNPMPVGTENVTISGSGFQTGALAYQSYGGYTGIQYSASSVAAGTVTVSGIYQGPASSVSFQVCNPGRVCSNAFSVPVSSSSSSSGGSASGASTYTLTVDNGTISAGGSTGNFAPGASVTIVANAPPTGQAFQSWSGFQVANPIGVTTTLTMPSSNITVAANYYTPAPVAFPITTHPRLWITQQDLPRLQSWAIGDNPAYQGMSAALATAISNYNLAFPPGPGQSLTTPVAASPYPDLGDTQGYTGILSEENAVILAFNSLIDPSQTNRIQYAQMAHNLLMYAMNQAALGQQANTPFRDPAFPIYNRASWSGHEWPLIVDWIYNAVDGNGNPILTAADKQTIRTVFMMWAQDCLTAETTGGDNPGQPGLVNSLALLPNNQPYRMASNNYYLAHARLLTMMALVLDPADDPPLNPNAPSAELGNTMRSYINDATGAWLYQEFAMMGDPATVAQAYNVPDNPSGAGFGLASGGLPPEGMLYGESFSYILGQLLALQTSGFNDPNLSGPQIGLIGAPVWDRYMVGYISSLTPTPIIPASEPYLGSVYQYTGYGDMLRLWVTPDQMEPWALLGLLDQERGIPTHVNAARWFALDAMPNGASALRSRMADPWTWGLQQDLLYFMLLDPTVAPPTDPRPAFPTLFYDAPQGRIVAHSDWSPNGTMFDYRASWLSINHQDGSSGEFALFRKGEWLTKEMSNYDGNVGYTTPYHNTLSLKNYCEACSSITWQGPDASTWNNGSQWILGEAAGDPTTVMSAGPGYVYAASNLTPLYNKPDSWSNQDSIMNVTQATRSIVWLNGASDFIVVYDRATTASTGLFKNWTMSMAANPQIAGNSATETMPDGQQLFVQTLLPAAPSLSSFNGAAQLSPVADLEPMQYIYQVQDPSNPSDTRFLHILQGADPGTPMALANYLQSTSGTDFDGASFASYAVFFPQNTATAFSGTTLNVPLGVHTVVVTGLAANTGYGVSAQAAPGADTITISPNGTTMTDNAGVLTVSI